MSTSELIARAVIPAVLVIALIGIPIALWWEKRRPTVPEHVAQMRAWRRLSTAEQRAVDNAALPGRPNLRAWPKTSKQAELDAQYDAQEAAQLAVERAAQINALTHP